MKNLKNKLLPRAYVMSHFSKHVTGSTRLATTPTITSGQEAAREYSSYIKGDSIIVMAIDTTKTGFDLKIKLPFKVKSGTHLKSTGNETENLCQEAPITIEESTDEILVEMPPYSLNTYIFIRDNVETAIEEKKQTELPDIITYYDLHGRKMETPHGLCIERHSNGPSKKVIIND